MALSELKSIWRSIPVLLTIVLSALTIAGAFSGYVHPASSPFMTTLGVAVPLLLLINIVVLLCWLFSRRSRYALLPLISLAVNYSYLFAVCSFSWFTPELPANHANATSPDGFLKIASYNVQYFAGESTGFSAKEIAAYLDKEAVDVVCLQEYAANPRFTGDSLQNVFSRYWQYAITDTLRPKDGKLTLLPVVVYSRYPLLNFRYIDYAGTPNSSLQCDIALGTDTIRLITNHLQTTSVSRNRRRLQRTMDYGDTRAKAQQVNSFVGALQENAMRRAEQTDTICKLIDASPYPLLVCGDLNALPSSYTYHQLSERLDDGFRTCGNGYMYTYRYYKRLLRIDYIFHSSSLTGCRYYSPNYEWCSDHNPVLMELRYRKEKT
jgi:endonuclease/exonuclease/phosphatase family metal-dependent hydrolase